MKTVIIAYERIAPFVLANIVEKAFSCLTTWHDIDEDYYEFSVYYCKASLDEVEDVLAEFV